MERGLNVGRKDSGCGTEPPFGDLFLFQAPQTPVVGLVWSGNVVLPSVLSPSLLLIGTFTCSLPFSC
jgi:hypothetical protein